MNKQDLKRYLVSSGITFIAVFLLTILPDLSDITFKSIETGAFLAIVIAATRAGVKAAIEILIPYIQGLITK